MSKVELWAGVSKQRQQRIKRAILKEERERLRGEIEAEVQLARQEAENVSQYDLQKKLDQFDRRRDGFVKNHIFYATPSEREAAEILRADRVRIEPLADFDRRLAASPYRTEQQAETFPESEDSFPETPPPAKAAE